MGSYRNVAGRLALAGVGVVGLRAASAGAAVQLFATGDAVVFNQWNSELPSHPAVPLTLDSVHTQPYAPGAVTTLGVSSGGSQDVDDLLYAPDAPLGSQPIHWSVSGSASASGRAELGALHAYATSSAHLNVLSQAYDYTSKVFPYDTKEVKKYNPFTISAYADAEVGWQDRFTVTSPTLAPGTEVQVRFTLVLDSHIDNDRSVTDYSTRAYTELFIPNPYGGQGLAVLQNEGVGGGYDSDHMVKVVTYPVYVGQPFDLAASLSITAQSGAQAYHLGYYALIDQNQDDLTTVDASNTAHFYLDVLTDGASVTSESGTSYASPVPEPTAFGVLLGLPALSSMRRRRA